MNDEQLNITEDKEIQQELKRVGLENEVEVYLAPFGKQSYSGERIDGKKLIIIAKDDYENKQKLPNIIRHELGHISSEHIGQGNVNIKSKIRNEIEAIRIEEGLITPNRLADIAVAIANNHNVSSRYAIKTTTDIARQEGISEQIITKAESILKRR